MIIKITNKHTKLVDTFILKQYDQILVPQNLVIMVIRHK